MSNRAAPVHHSGDGEEQSEAHQSWLRGSQACDKAGADWVLDSQTPRHCSEELRMEWGLSPQTGWGRGGTPAGPLGELLVFMAGAGLGLVVA